MNPMSHHTQYSLDWSDQQWARTPAQTLTVQCMWKHEKSQLTRNIPAGFIYPVNRRSVKLSFLFCNHREWSNDHETGGFRPTVWSDDAANSHTRPHSGIFHNCCETCFKNGHLGYSDTISQSAHFRFCCLNPKLNYACSHDFLKAPHNRLERQHC